MTRSKSTFNWLSALHRFGTIAAFTFALAFASGAAADFHTFQIEQIYSNADGSIQFIVLHEGSFAIGQQFWSGHALTSTGKVRNTYVFPNNLPGPNTANKRVLIATQGFAALGLITPDYVVPNAFLDTGGGILDYGGVDSINYFTLPVDGVSAVNRALAVIPNVATNFAGKTASVSGAGIPAAANYEGLWWNSPAGSESGWGINFAHQGDIIFATWFTYDMNGKAWWLSMTAPKTGANMYAGMLFQTAGPAFNSVPFNPAGVVRTPVGSASLTFTDANTAQFTYTVNGVMQTKTLTRQVFGTLPTCTFGAQPNLALASNYQDLWWASPADSESGWGINLTDQSNIIFGTWFTYDLDGTPLWLSVTATSTAPNVFTGTLFRTTGPAFDAMPFDPAKVVRTPVGTATFTFSNGNDATFAYTVNGISQTKAIARQVFVTPGTVCL